MTENESKISKSALYMRNYRVRKRIKDEKFADTLALLSTDVKDVVVELIRASNSNPLIGILVSIVSVDILSRAHIIDSATAAGLYVAIGAIEGASVAGTIISDFTDVFKIFSKSPTQDLVRPSASTIVYEMSKGKDLQTLMNKE